YTGWNDPGITLFSVGQVWRNAELTLAPDFHASYTFVPALDDLAASELELKRFAGPDRAVELLAVGQPAGVIDFDVLSALGEGAGANLGVPIFQTAGGLDGSSRDLGGSAGGWLGCRLLRWSRLGNGQGR